MFRFFTKSVKLEREKNPFAMEFPSNKKCHTQKNKLSASDNLTILNTTYITYSFKDIWIQQIFIKGLVYDRQEA